MTARTFGPGSATLEVLVFRDGLLSAVGHDLLLRPAGFEIAVEEREQGVAVRVDAGSLRVLTAMRDGRPLPGALGPADAREIEALAAAVLRAERFPEIRFASTEVNPRGGGYDLHGSLALAGATRSLVIAVRRCDGRLVAEVTLHQPDFGIRPYRAMLGALRVKPEVIVRAALG